MNRSTSIYGSSSSLRGIQMKIGERFKPALKVTLPVGWKTRDQSQLLSLTYDFSLEEEVIARYKTEKEAKEKHEEAEKLKQLNNQLKTLNPIMANLGSEILQPTTASSTTSTTSTTNSLSKEFDYKDFEDNTDTPFESVELQCINNMDALRSVLQPDVESDSVIQTSQSVSGAKLDNNVYSGNVPIQNSNVDDIQHRSTINGSPNYVSPSNGPPNYSDVGTINSDRKPFLPGAMRVLPSMPIRLPPPPSRRISVPNEGSSLEATTGLHNQFERPSVSQGGKKPIPRPRSKLPPINNTPSSTSFDEPLYDTPPPPLPPKKFIGNNKMTNHNQTTISSDPPSVSHFASPLPPISPPKPHVTSLVNDPRQTMTREEVELVDKLSAMGFDIGRVARAVKHFGCKETEVAEYLISLNEICEKGFLESQVEMVLKDKVEKTKAVDFLKLIVQFKELGFEEGKVFEALKKSGCDSNKTLDILTCAG